MSRVNPYLEHNVFLEDMLDTSDLILSLAFSELRRRRAAVENIAVFHKFRHLCQLLSVDGTGFFGRGWRRSVGNLFRCRNADDVKCAGTCFRD